MKRKPFIASTLLSAALAVTLTAQAQSSFSHVQVADIQKIVHDYIIDNPKILVEASQKLRAQMQEKEQKAAMSAIKSNVKALFHDPESPVMGNPHGTITIVEFFDYQCGHCKEMAPIVDQTIATNHQVKIILKQLPIFGADSEFAARASLAANKVAPHQLAAFHKALMKAGNPLKNKDVMKIAKSVGINTTKLKTAMKSSGVVSEIKANFQLAQKLQLVGTPAFVVANTTQGKYQFMPGAMPKDKLDQMIKAVQ